MRDPDIHSGRMDGMDKRHGKSWRSLLLCAALLSGSFLCERLSLPTAIARGYLADGKGQSGAIVQAAGEFRIVAANLLWAKVLDHYHHQYLADGGDWAKNVSLLPLLQSIIMLDPHFTEAYELMGGTILPRTGREAQGKAILVEGIKNNPADWELYREIAMLYAWNDHCPQAALPYAKAGLEQATRIKDDDGFSSHLMSMLCTTLRRQIRDQGRNGSEKWSKEAFNAPHDRQPEPAPEASAPQLPPSASG